MDSSCFICVNVLVDDPRKQRGISKGTAWTPPRPVDIIITSTFYFVFVVQVVDTLEAEAPGLIQVPKLDERVDGVGDHLNFRLVGASEEENISFQVRRGRHI